MSILEMLLLIALLVVSIFLAVAVIFPMLKSKGIDTGDMIEIAGVSVEGVEVNDTIISIVEGSIEACVLALGHNPA